MRCDPEDAIHLKKIMTRLSLSSTNTIQFMPTGMIQLTGHNAYKNALRSQNEYLQNIATFPLYNTNMKQMEMLEPEILKNPSIKRLLKTKKTEDNGRWLIETTKSKLAQAQKHIDTILNAVEAFDDTCTSSRINPSLAHEDMVQYTKAFTEVYDNVTHT